MSRGFILFIAFCSLPEGPTETSQGLLGNCNFCGNLGPYKFIWLEQLEGPQKWLALERSPPCPPQEGAPKPDRA